MRELVAQGMREGAVGMSSGLSYTPGMYAGTDELVELCEVVAAHNGYHSPHHRSYGAGALAGIRGDDRDLPPLRLPAASGPRHHELQRQRGPRRRARWSSSTPPWQRAATSASTPTPTCRAPRRWPRCSRAGRPKAARTRCWPGSRDPAARERIRIDVEERGSDGNHGMVVDWHTIQISGVARSRAGRTSSARPSPRSRPRARSADRPAPSVLRPAARRPARDDDPAPRRQRGERAGRHAAPRAHRSAATACWSEHVRIRAPGARSRAISATTAGNSMS